MNHPPIPPNCDYFKLECDEWTFGLPGVTTNVVPESNSAKDEHFARRLRPVIACVARCAWLDESERIIEVRRNMPNGEPYEYCRKAKALKEEAYKASDNAEAWRKWGGGKRRGR
jgi:hypothetical protein